MADYIVQMKQFNGSTYDNIYPLSTGGMIDCTITPVVSGVTLTLTGEGKTYSGTFDSTGKCRIIVINYGTYTISSSDSNVMLQSTTIDVNFSGKYTINAFYKTGVVYTVRIDETNSNSLSCITYQDDAVGMTKGSASWDSQPIFNGIKPCVLTNGTVSYYLNPTNFAYQTNGSTATINGSGDVMIEFTKFAYRIYRNGNYLYVSITNDPAIVASDNRFKYYAFSRNSEGDREKMYVGAYHGFVSSSRLYSWSSRVPTVNTTIGNFRTYAQAKGTGYHLFSFYQLTALQCLFLIKYGNLNSQTALGMGFVSSGSNAVSTGAANTSGMYSGSASGSTHIKFAGIEDFWGNVFDWIDGLYNDGNRNILTAYKSFNDTGSGYINNGQGSTANIGGYISKVQGATGTGFIPYATSGSDTTFFADYGDLNAGCLPNFGGYWSSGSAAGAFLLGVYYSASDAFSYFGARLSYC